MRLSMHLRHRARPGTSRGTLVSWLAGLGAIAALLGAAAAPARAGTFFVLPLTDDASTGISTAKTYTHAADVVNAWSINPAATNVKTVTIGGVAFEVGNTTGTYWSLDAPSIYTGNSGTGGVGGQVGELMRYFRYGPASGNATLTLPGLAPGETYTTTWYSKSWEAAGRTVTISASDGGSIFFDQDYYGAGAGNMLQCSFVAPASGSITYTFANGPARFHHYGFSNELTSTPNQWNVAGGGSWNLAGNWSASTVPNGVGAVAWLLKESGTAAAVTLDAPVTVGSLYLDNTAGYNVAGPNALTMQAASGGRWFGEWTAATPSPPRSSSIATRSSPPPTGGRSSLQARSAAPASSTPPAPAPFTGSGRAWSW